MKFKDLIVAKPEELVHELSKARRELYDLNINNHSRQLKETHKIRDKKKDIARILTAIKEIGASANNVPVFESTEAVSDTKENETISKKASNESSKDAKPIAKKRVKKNEE